MRFLHAYHWLFALFFTATAAHAASQPNILFILTEDQGPHMSFLETPGVETPNMDSIAENGVYFREAFVAYPVCSASKAAIYTGVHNHVNGLQGNTYNFFKPDSQVTDAERNRPLTRRSFIRDAYPTLVEKLHAAGYYTATTHKLHVLPNKKFPYDEFRRHMDPQQVVDFTRRAKNLADDPSYRDQLNRLRTALAKWIEETDDAAVSVDKLLAD